MNKTNQLPLEVNRYLGGRAVQNRLVAGPHARRPARDGYRDCRRERRFDLARMYVVVPIVILDLFIALVLAALR